ncbi:MAG: Na+/H+ antiporter subunit E [Steroidobacteraceae bacterium]
MILVRLWYAIRYGFIFAKALTMSTIDVTKAVLRPAMDFRPGFLAVDMECETDLEITLLANSITLTPGTISVHVEREQRKIIIHALNVGDDPEAVRRDVKQTLEANILRFTRPDAPRRSGT